MRSYPLMIVAMITCLGVFTPAHAQAPIPGQPYQIPAGFEGSSAGTLIAYGGYNYVSQDNGTMLLADSQGNGTPDNSVPADNSVPIDTTAYQIPPGYENSQSGSQISYGGNDYTIMPGGTMMMANPGYSVVDGTQYQIPPDYAGVGVGSIIPYGGFNYMAGAGVMVKININPGYTTTTGPGKSSLLVPNQTGKTWTNQNPVQQQHWPNQNQAQQQRWPNQNQAQQQRWPNQNPVQQQRWPNQGYSRGYSSGPVSRPGPMANPGTSRGRR